MNPDHLLLGFSLATTPVNLLFAFLGVLLGTIIGALPGIGPSAGVAVLLPVTFGMSPVTAMIMLAGIYYGAMYGGTITSVLINTPGESASVMTTLDGFQMALNGRAGAALGMAAIGSFIAGTLSVVLLMLAAPPLADWAVTFGPPEYFALMVLGLTTLASLTGGSMLKGLAMALTGLLLGTIGIDLMIGEPRFTFGMVELYDRLDFLPVAVGLFAIGEILYNIYRPVRLEPIKASLSGLLPTRQDWRDSAGAIGRGTAIGFFVGVLPGAGATIASFLAYATEKRVSRRPEKFGTGRHRRGSGAGVGQQRRVHGRAGAADGARHSRLGHHGSDARRADALWIAARAAADEHEPGSVLGTGRQHVRRQRHAAHLESSARAGVREHSAHSL